MLRGSFIKRFFSLASTSLGCSGMSSGGRETSFFLGSGERIDKPEFLRRVAESSARVVCVGENHEDAEAHSLELQILRRIHDEQAGQSRALSLEFYDREAQTVLDEYLKNLVSLDTFLADSRPPSNHSDYQKLIDFCRDSDWPVIAANCPRRYTRMVGRNGRTVLDALADSGAANLLPPLPYAGASEAYTANFVSIMEKMGNSSARVPTSMLDAQSLWDATMAHSIAEGLARGAEKIVHVTGYFHIQHRLGTVEHLARYAPHAEVLVVVILPSEELEHLNPDQRNIGDLVALTDIHAIQ